MIAACALRCNAGAMVALDQDHVVLLRDLEIPVRHPEDFIDKQGRFFFEDEASS
jgi:hypothetical protein